MKRYTGKEKSLNILLILLSLLIGLLICEVGLRLVKEKSDIFPTNPTPDPILGLRLQPFESGTDARGFRNSKAEGYFPILCIGDSLTYGYGLPLKDTIPQQLSLILGKNVYNMGLPSYGPVQYYELYKVSRKMQPQKTIIAFFMGNDLLDAYFLVKKNKYWHWLLKEIGGDDQLRALSFCSLPVDTDKIDVQYLDPERINLNLRKGGSLIWAVHSWLRLHSALYANAFELIVKPLVQKHLQLPGFFHTPSIDTVFVPGGNLKFQDLHDPRVRSGLLITKRIIELLSLEQRGQPDLLFTIIPTKENVYYEFLKKKNITLPNEFECAVHYEREISQWLTEIITANGVGFVNVFPPLAESAADGTLLYQQLSDCHLNRAGNRIVATALGKALKDQ